MYLMNSYHYLVSTDDNSTHFNSINVTNVVKYIKEAESTKSLGIIHIHKYLKKSSEHIKIKIFFIKFVH